MRIVRLADSIQTSSLVQDSVPPPSPGRGELLIRVYAAGVTSTERSRYPTSHRRTGEARTAAVPAHESSGVVAAVGEEVGALEIGQEVFGMNGWYSDGALAEYCVAPFFAVAPKPPGLSHFEAASVPISALSAWQVTAARGAVHRTRSVMYTPPKMTRHDSVSPSVTCSWRMTTPKTIANSGCR